MKKSYFLYFITAILCLQCLVSTGQEKPDLDRLERRLSELRNTNPDETIRIGNHILEHSVSDRQKSGTLALMSFAYYAKNDSKKFAELLFQSKELAERTNDPEVIARVYGTVAQLYLSIDFQDKAAEYLRNAIDQIQKMPKNDTHYTLKGLSLIELGKIRANENRFAEATDYFRTSLVEFRKLDDKSAYFIKRSYYNLADSYYRLNKLDSARLYVDRTLNIKDNPGVDQYALYTLSQIYTGKDQHQRAIDLLLPLSEKQLNDDSLTSEIYLLILKNYEAIGNLEKYNVFNDKYLALNNKISKANVNTIKNVVKVEEKSLAGKITTANRQNTWLLIVVAIISCLTIALFLYIRKQKLPVADIQQQDHLISIKPAKDPAPMLSPENEQHILDKLARFEQSEKFTNPKINIATLAVQMKTNTTYLSNVINKYKGKNFSAYINELRINYICRQIQNHPEYLSYKISYLGELAGFTSHSTFTTTFKSVTGISPSTFLNDAGKNATDL